MLLAAASLSNGSAGLVGRAAEGPCDIYAAGGTPCVAAHSMARALYATYDGSLYTVRRADGQTKDIGVDGPGGFAQAAAQDAFCGRAGCVVSRIFDQSPHGNHIAPPTSSGGRSYQCPSSGCKPVNATKQRHSVGGHPIWAAVFEGGMGYRNDSTSGVATGDEPESIYMVASGTHYNDGCCFDYGNAEPDMKDDGTGTMEAVYWGNSSGGPMNHGGSGKGPWVMADLEKGLWGANVTRSNEPPLMAAYVTVMLKGGANLFALKGGDAQAQVPPTRFYEGVRPSGASLPGGGNYNPMRKKGAIILGVGGDNSDKAVGTFFEGAITRGYASDATDAAVHRNVVSAGYGR